MFKQKNPDPVTGVDYEALGRAIDKTMVRDYIHLIGNTPRMMWSAFLRGIMLGFGTVIGGTVVVAILVGVLSQFNTAPVIGEYLTKISNTITTGQPSTTTTTTTTTNTTPSPSPTTSK